MERSSLFKPVSLSMVILLIVFTGLWMNQRSRPSNAGNLPKLSLEQVTGEALSLSGLQGQPVVINLWATWCGPCRRELPLLQESSVRRPDIHYLFVSQQESKERVNRFLKENQLELEHVLLDPKGQLADVFRSRGLPTTLFFDSSGELVDAYLGELTSVSLFNALKNLE